MKGKGKPKKGKGKKPAEEAEEAESPPIEAADAPPVQPDDAARPVSELDSRNDGPVDEVVVPPTEDEEQSPPRADPSSTNTSRHPAVAGEGDVEEPEIPANVEKPALDPTSLGVTGADNAVDLSMIVEGEEESSSGSLRPSNAVSKPIAPATIAIAESTTTITPQQPAVEVSIESLRELGPILGTSPAMDEAHPTPSPIVINPTVPVREVRSSWLRQALGTGTVPLAGLPANSGIRQSFASQSQRPNAAVDFAALRKSLVPVGGLKRKSDVGVDEDVDEEEKRPEKIVKMESASKLVVEEEISEPITLPVMAELTSTLANPATTDTPGPDSQILQNHNDRHRSDIHKVTRALDELRERTQAKELAKQRATLAASGSAKPVQTATSTGSGFLRGLGSLGVGLGRSLGLGGSAKTAEEEAMRLQRELEDERRVEMEAQEELERLIGGVSKPVAVEAETRDSRTPEVHEVVVPPRGKEESESPEVEEKVEEVIVEEAEEVIEDRHDQALQAVQVPRAVEASQHHRAHTPVRAELLVIESTTPTNTPPRFPAVQDEAPAIHARAEKHSHAAPAIVAKSNKPTEPVFEIVPAQSVESKQPKSPRSEAGLRRSQAIAIDDDGNEGDMHDYEEDQLDDEEEEMVEEPMMRDGEGSTVSISVGLVVRMLTRATGSSEVAIVPFFCDGTVKPSWFLHVFPGDEQWHPRPGIYHRRQSPGLQAGHRAGQESSARCSRQRKGASGVSKVYNIHGLWSMTFVGTSCERSESSHERSSGTTQAASRQAQGRGRPGTSGRRP